MAYTRHLWQAREGTGLNKFTKTGETTGYVYLTNAPDSVTVAGTPFTVDWMNELESATEYFSGRVDYVGNRTGFDTIMTSFSGLSQTPRLWHGMTTLGSDVYACVIGGDIYKQSGGVGNFIALGQTSREWVGMTTLDVIS